MDFIRQNIHEYIPEVAKAKKTMDDVGNVEITQTAGDLTKIQNDGTPALVEGDTVKASKVVLLNDNKLLGKNGEKVAAFVKEKAAFEAIIDSEANMTFEKSLIEYLKSMANDTNYRNHLLVALKRATKDGKDIDAIISYLMGGFTAYEGNDTKSCVEGQQERIIIIASVYGELPLNTCGRLKAQEKRFFEQYGDTLCTILINELIEQLPSESRSPECWVESSEKQQKLIKVCVKSLLEKRYGNAETAEYMSKKLIDGGQWLTKLLDSLEGSNDIDQEDINKTTKAEVEFFNEIAVNMLSEGNESLLRTEARTSMSDINLTIDKNATLTIQNRRAESYGFQLDKVILDLTPEEWLDWSKVEDFKIDEKIDQKKEEIIAQQKLYLLTRAQLEAIEPSVISDLARQEGTTILRVIDEIERSSERNDQIILIKKLLKYMVENNDEKLLPLMLPYLHHIDKDVLGTESLADELSIWSKIEAELIARKKLAQNALTKLTVMNTKRVH